MDKEQLIAHISEAAKEGRQKQEIITELKLEGYKLPDIQDAYSTWENTPIPDEPNSAPAGSATDPSSAAAVRTNAVETVHPADSGITADQPPGIPSPPAHPHYRLFLIGGIILLLVSGGLFLALRQRSQPPPASPPAITTTPEPLPIPTTEEASPTATLLLRPGVADCGTSSPDQSDADIERADTCIQEQFQSCTAATYTTELDLTPLEGIGTYHYEIIGKRGGSCLVKISFVKNPNQELVGPEMTCKLDNTTDFLTATQEYTLCSGPLRELMQQEQSQQ